MRAGAPVALTFLLVGCMGPSVDEASGDRAALSSAPPDPPPAREGQTDANGTSEPAPAPPPEPSDGIAETFRTPAAHDCITDGIQFPVGLDRAAHYLPPGWVPEDRAQAARAVTDMPIPDQGQGSVTLAAWTCKRHGFAGGPANLSSVMTWVKPPVFEGVQTPEAKIHLFLSEIATTNESIRRFYERLGTKVTHADTKRIVEAGLVRDLVTTSEGEMYSLEIRPVTQASAVTSIVWISNEHGTGYVYQSVAPPEFGQGSCRVAPGSHASYLVTNAACPPDTLGGILDAAYENEFRWFRGLHPTS